MARLKIGNVFPPVAYLLKHCAPAGYGLGASAKILSDADDLDTVWQSGWYRWGESVPNNAPMLKGSKTYGYMRVDGSNEGTFFQTVYSVRGESRGLSVKRDVTEGSAGEWEFINPPMQPGVEYRTTERWNGKPVYIKAVDLGNLPDAANTMGSAWVDGSFYGSGVKSVIACGGCLYKATEWAGALPYVSAGIRVDVVAGSTTVGVIASNGSFSDRTATVWVKYTKD